MIVALRISNLPFHRVTQDASESPVMVDLTLPPGSMARILGRCASGKTSAASTLAGMNDADSHECLVEINGENLLQASGLRKAELLAIVPTDTKLLFSGIVNTVQKEVELSYSFLGKPPVQSEIQRLMDRLEIGHLAERYPFDLSEGEMVRAALAIALAKKPRILILDDIFGALHPASRQLIHKVLAEERYLTGLVLIEIHSRTPSHVEDEACTWVFLLPSGAVCGSFEHCQQKVASEDPFLLPPLLRFCTRLEQKAGRRYPVPAKTPEEAAAPLHIDLAHFRRNSTAWKSGTERTLDFCISIHGLSFQYPGEGAFRLGPVTYQFGKNRCTAIFGSNGAGKTTLLKCLGNVNPAGSGEILVHDSEGLSPSKPLHVWAKSVMYCFQNPDDQLFLPTVNQELNEAARQIHGRGHERNVDVIRIAEALGLTAHLSTSPFSLPRPLRRLVTLAGALIASPSVLLLDEPTSGLDQRQIQMVLELLHCYMDKGGSIVLVSHDYDFVAEMADDVILMDAGLIQGNGNRERGFNDWPGGVVPVVVSIANLLNAPAPVWREADLVDIVVFGGIQPTD